MSRSKKNRKLKFGGFFHWVTFKSNKKDKRIANRTMRHNNKILIKLGKDPINKVKEIYDNWNFNSDGGAKYRTYNKQNRFGVSYSIWGQEAWSQENINYMNRK